jgi:hypothetical protein
MKEFRTRGLLFAVGAVCSLLLAGCLDQEETITVAKDGSVAIEVKLSGKPDQLSDPILIPAGPDWQIRERKIDSSGDSPELTIVAVANTPYGRPLPEAFVSRSSPEYDLCLRFPGEVTMKSEGNRTYYTFRRTYAARRFSAFDLSEVPEAWDHNLETRVLDSGLLKVSQKDRDQYLRQLTENYNYQCWRYFREAIAALVGSHTIADTVFVRLGKDAADYLDNTATPDLFLNVMQREEPQIQAAIDSLGLIIDRQFRTLVTGAVHGNSTALAQFDTAYAKVRREYEVTEKHNGMNYRITLVMPGTVISTNGVLEPEEPGKVTWSFGGKKFRDADVSLTATSVVER